MSQDRVQISAGFTTIPNHILRDESLSLEAKGMLGIVVSMAESWTFYRDDMMRRAQVGKGKYYKIINELKAAGILHIEENRGESGTFGGRTWIVTFTPCTENEDMVSPCTDLTDGGEIETHKKNNLLKKKKQTTNRASQFPVAWMPSQTTIQHCLNKGYDQSQIGQMVEDCVNHHRGKGTTFKDHNAGFRTWASNEIKFHGTPEQQRNKKHGRSSKNSSSDPTLRAIASAATAF